MSDDNIVTVSGGPEADEPLAHTLPVPSQEAPETPTPEASAEDAAAPEAPETPVDDTDAEAKPEKPRGFMQRIDKLTRKAGEAERRAELAEAQLAQMRATPQQPTPAAPKAPETNDFAGGEFDPLYVAAVARYEGRMAAMEENRSAREAEARAADQRSFETRRDTLLSKMTDKHVGAEKILSDGNAPMTREMADFILDSAKGVDLLDALGRDYPEAARIAALPPVKQGAALATLEAKLSAPKFSAATPPPPSVGGRAPASTTLRDDMSQAEFEATWNQTRQKKR